jgi:hypothetical protein
MALNPRSGAQVSRSVGPASPARLQIVDRAPSVEAVPEARPPLQSSGLALPPRLKVTA